MANGKMTKNYSDIAESYAQSIIDARIPASKWVKLSCQRQLDDLKKKNGGYFFEPERVNSICSFIEKLPHIKGEWAKNNGSLVLQPWQTFILATVFGWVRSDGRRRFKTAYIEIPRKNGKSTLSAAVGLYMLSKDGEPGAQVYSAAVTRDQAKIVFEDAQAMAKREEGFRKRYGIQVNAHNINILEKASKFEALSAEANSLDGLNIHCAIEDELHAHKTRAVFDVLETSMGSRTQPLHWLITTAGSNRSGICYEQHSYLKKILEKVAEDESYFGIIYGLDDGDDWRLESNWRKANPNYEISIYPEDFKRLAGKAQEMASAQNAFLTKRLNVWVNADTSWMDMLKWDKCRDERLKLADFETENCWIGIDLASKLDIASVCILFKHGADYYAFLRHYLPEDNVKSEAHAKSAHCQGWAIQGWLTLTPGNMIDLDFIEEDLRGLLGRFDVNVLAFDPWQAAQMQARLLADNAPVATVSPNVQNFSDPMKTLEGLVLAAKFHTNDDPIITWMISNVVCHRDAKDNIYPRKETPENKIDGVVALLTALNRALADDGGSSRSIYEERGLEFV